MALVNDTKRGNNTFGPRLNIVLGKTIVFLDFLLSVECYQNFDYLSF